MINLTRVIEMTSTSYFPQFDSKTSKYYDDDFYITTGRFKEMCVNKYDGKGYRFSLHPFKVVML